MLRVARPIRFVRQAAPGLTLGNHKADEPVRERCVRREFTERTNGFFVGALQRAGGFLLGAEHRQADAPQGRVMTLSEQTDRGRIAAADRADNVNIRQYRTRSFADGIAGTHDDVMPRTGRGYRIAPPGVTIRLAPHRID